MQSSRGFTLCKSFPTLGIKLEHRDRSNEERGFRVVYGKEVHEDCTYEQAAHEIGCAIMHSLACDSAFAS